MSNGRPRGSKRKFINDGETKFVTVRMPMKLAGALYRAASRRSLPNKRVFVSDIIREAVRQFLKEEPK